MALESGRSLWKNFFTDAGIPPAEAETYAEAFINDRIDDPSDLTKDLLKDLGVTVVGDIIAIQKHAKLISDNEQEQKPQLQPQQSQPQQQVVNSTVSTQMRYKPGNVTPPLLKADCTKPQFRKFKIDWQIHKQITQLPADQIPAHCSREDNNI